MPFGTPPPYSDRGIVGSEKGCSCRSTAQGYASAVPRGLGRLKSGPQFIPARISNLATFVVQHSRRMHPNHSGLRRCFSSSQASLSSSVSASFSSFTTYNGSSAVPGEVLDDLNEMMGESWSCATQRCRVAVHPQGIFSIVLGIIFRLAFAAASTRWRNNAAGEQSCTYNARRPRKTITDAPWPRADSAAGSMIASIACKECAVPRIPKGHSQV